MLNNPINFNDPTGHVCEDPEKEEAACFGTGTTRVGDRMIRGNHSEVGKAKNLNIKPKRPVPPTYGNGLIGPSLPTPEGITPPDYDLNPSHADYRSSVYNVYALTVIYSTDRYDRKYLAVGGTWNIKSVLHFGYSYVVGSMNPSVYKSTIAGPDDVHKFMTGASFNFTGGALTGAGTTLSPSILIENGFTQELKPSSFETGLYFVPSIGLTGTYGIPLGR